MNGCPRQQFLLCKLRQRRFNDSRTIVQNKTTKNKKDGPSRKRGSQCKHPFSTHHLLSPLSFACRISLAPFSQGRGGARVKGRAREWEQKSVGISFLGVQPPQEAALLSEEQTDITNLTWWSLGVVVVKCVCWAERTERSSRGPSLHNRVLQAVRGNARRACGYVSPVQQIYMTGSSNI